MLSSKIYLFVLSREIVNINNDIAWKFGNVTIEDFRNKKKLEYKKNKLNLDIHFLSNWKQLHGYPNFLIFKPPNFSNKDALSIRKRILRRSINKRNKNCNIFENNSVYPNTFYLHSFLLLTSTPLQNL